jgi:hypothetical protein
MSNFFLTISIYNLKKTNNYGINGFVYFETVQLHGQTCWVWGFHSRVLIAAWFIWFPWRWKRYVPLKGLLNFTEIHSIKPQKTGLWTSNSFTEGPVAFNRTRGRRCTVSTGTASLNNQLKKRHVKFQILKRRRMWLWKYCSMDSEGIRWRWVVSFTFRLLYPQRKNPGVFFWDLNP